MTAGQPDNVDACRWKCEVGFFQSSTFTCDPCTTSQCKDPGFYREMCTELGELEDAKCLECPSDWLPADASWISSEECAWNCNRGFEENHFVDDSASACQPSQKPSILLSAPNPDKVKEADVLTPANVQVKLSEPPTSDVTIIFAVSEQISMLSTMAFSTLVFTAASWNESQTISVVPKDDDVREGDHSGTILVQSVTSSDILYNDLNTTSPLNVPIEDNDCAPLVTPEYGTIIGLHGSTSGNAHCIATYGHKCNVQCNKGFDPIEPVTITCLSTGSWNRRVPTCTPCADEFYPANIGPKMYCRDCSKEICTQVGTYRSACPWDGVSGTSDVGDSECISCSNFKPLNSEYTTAGDPYNANNCKWSCLAGFYKEYVPPLEPHAGDNAWACKRCTLEACPVGMYILTNCTTTEDRTCAPCTNKRPDQSQYTSSGTASGTCEWQCNEGFEQTGQSCVALPDHAIIITPIRLQTKEDPFSLPASFEVGLTRQQPVL